MYGFFYRMIMRISHKYYWHYAPPIYPEGDIQLWCKWCGFRQTIKRRPNELLPQLDPFYDEDEIEWLEILRKDIKEGKMTSLGERIF